MSLATGTNLFSFSMRTTRPSERHEQAAIYTAEERDEDKDGERPPSYSSKLLQKIAEFYSKSDSTGQQFKSPFVGRHIETLQRSAPPPLLHSILSHHIAIHFISAHHFTSHHTYPSPFLRQSSHPSLFLLLFIPLSQNFIFLISRFSSHHHKTVPRTLLKDRPPLR